MFKQKLKIDAPLSEKLTKDKVVLSQLCVPNFLIHGVSGVVIDFTHKPSTVKLILHLLKKKYLVFIGKVKIFRSIFFYKISL